MKETIRNITSSDYDHIINQLNEWWGGRNMTDMLPRLFFKHFNTTGFAIEQDEVLSGFLVGFVSQTNPTLGYVHFIGINPKFRNQQPGRKLYMAFFNEMKRQDVSNVECVTSPVNTSSIAFHKAPGFEPQKGNQITQAQVPYFTDYDGEGEHRVVFNYQL